MLSIIFNLQMEQFYLSSLGMGMYINLSPNVLYFKIPITIRLVSAKLAKDNKNYHFKGCQNSNELNLR